MAEGHRVAADNGEKDGQRQDGEEEAKTWTGTRKKTPDKAFSVALAGIARRLLAGVSSQRKVRSMVHLLLCRTPTLTSTNRAATAVRESFCALPAFGRGEAIPFVFTSPHLHGGDKEW